ncbi:ester cyclase [Halostella sp. PRR32]|uniref:ester cyclase n=1 Tax=Halostella sp. PRR32 TaxID=3098147 RepID=UPI002B1D92AD|nr:ester cyclase [Halostella sp. PRR32]
MAQSTSDVEQCVEEWIDVWNTGGYERLPDVLDESATVYDPGAPGGVLEGREEFEAHLRELRAGFPDFTIGIAEMLSKDGIVMTEWTATATHEGEFNGIPATDREIEFQGMSKTEIRDSEIVEDRIYHDFHAFLEQLGLTEK